MPSQLQAEFIQVKAVAHLLLPCFCHGLGLCIMGGGAGPADSATAGPMF